MESFLEFLDRVKNKCDDCPIQKSGTIKCRYQCGTWGCYEMLAQNNLIKKVGNKNE